MSEAEEEVYLRGQRQVWRQLLSECLKHLGAQERHEWGWLAEREAAIAQLRMVCHSHGDNDWDENLHLADIIEKHLADHLD